MHHAITCLPSVLGNKEDEKSLSSFSSSSTPTLVPCYNSILPCEIFYHPKDVDFFIYSHTKPAMYFNCKNHSEHRTTKWKSSGKLYDWSPDGWNDICYPIQNVVGYDIRTNIKTHVMRISAIHSKDQTTILLPIWLIQIRNRDADSRLGQNSSSDIDVSSYHDITKAECTASAILRHQQQQVIPVNLPKDTEAENDNEENNHNSIAEEYDDNDTPLTHNNTPYSNFHPNMIEQLLHSYLNPTNNAMVTASTNSIGSISETVQILNTLGSTFHSIAASLQSHTEPSSTTRTFLPFEIETSNRENVPTGIPKIMGGNYLHVTIPAQKLGTNNSSTSPSSLALSTALVSSTTNVNSSSSSSSTTTSPLLSPMRCNSQSSSTVYSPESTTSTIHRQLSRNNSTPSQTSPLHSSASKFERLHQEASFDDVPLQRIDMNSNDGTVTSKRRRSKSRDTNMDDIMKLTIPIDDDTAMNTCDSVRVSSRNETTARSTTPGTRNRKTPKSTPKSAKSPGNISTVHTKSRERASTTTSLVGSREGMSSNPRSRFYSDHDMNTNQSYVSTNRTEDENNNTNMSVTVSRMETCVSNGPSQSTMKSTPKDGTKQEKRVYTNFTDAIKHFPAKTGLFVTTTANLVQPIGQRIANITTQRTNSNSSTSSTSSTSSSVLLPLQKFTNSLSSTAQSVFKGKDKTATVNRISPKLIPSSTFVAVKENHSTTMRRNGSSSPPRARRSTSLTDTDERTSSPCPPNWDTTTDQPMIPAASLPNDFSNLVAPSVPASSASSFMKYSTVLPCYDSEGSIHEVFPKTTKDSSLSQETVSTTISVPTMHTGENRPDFGTITNEYLDSFNLDTFLSVPVPDLIGNRSTNTNTASLLSTSSSMNINSRTGTLLVPPMGTSSTNSNRSTNGNGGGGIGGLFLSTLSPNTASPFVSTNYPSPHPHNNGYNNGNLSFSLSSPSLAVENSSVTGSGPYPSVKSMAHTGTSRNGSVTTSSTRTVTVSKPHQEPHNQISWLPVSRFNSFDL